MSKFNSKKTYLYSSIGNLSFAPYTATMSPWKKQALKCMREELGKVHMQDVGMIKKLEISVIRSSANLTLGFLSQMQLQVVESKTTPAEQMNKVIDFLLEMEDKYFEYFCKILEQSNFELKANELRKKAEEYERYIGKLNISNTLACILTLQRPAKCKLRNVNWLISSHPDYCLNCVS